MKHSRYIVIAVLNALFYTSFAQAAVTGEQIPSCELSSLHTESSINLNKLKGKILYVDFWASWCPSCVKSFSFLNKLKTEFKAQGLEIIAVNLDETIDDAKQFLTQHPAQFTIMADLSKKCARDFDVKAMPSAYLVDGNGIVRHIHLGFRADETDGLKEEVEVLINELNPQLSAISKPSPVH